MSSERLNGQGQKNERGSSGFDSLKDVPFRGDIEEVPQDFEDEVEDPILIPKGYICNRTRRPLYAEALKQEGTGKAAKACREVLNEIAGDKILMYDILSAYEKGYRDGNKVLVDKLSKIFGIDPPEIKYHRIRVHSIAGAYDPEDNSIHFYYRRNRSRRGTTDDMNTIAHETWHAYQEAVLRNKKGVRSDLYRINSNLYISSEDDFERYKKQIFEMEAFFFGDKLEHALIGGINSHLNFYPFTIPERINRYFSKLKEQHSREQSRY